MSYVVTACFLMRIQVRQKTRSSPFLSPGLRPTDALDTGIEEALRRAPEALDDSALQNFDLIHQHVGGEWTPESIMDMGLS